MKQSFFLVHQVARKRALQAVSEAPEGYKVTISPPGRNLEQNAKMWACLGDVSAQVKWHGRKLSPEEWKHLFSATLSKLDVVPNLDGTGFVALGKSTANMGKAEMAEMIELILAFGAERGVIFSDGYTSPA